MTEGEFRALLAVKGEELIVYSIPNSDEPMWLCSVQDHTGAVMSIAAEDSASTREEAVQSLVARYFK